MSKAERVQKALLICFYSVYSVMMLFTTVTCFLEPLHYLSPIKMFPVFILTFGLFILFSKVWCRIPEKIADSNIVFLALTTILITLILVTAILHGKEKYGYGDYYFVMHSAEELASGRDITHYNYFCIYGNNTLPMLILSVIIRICYEIGLDHFYFLLFLNILILLGSLWSMCFLMKDHIKRIRIPILLFLIVCLPIYVFTGVFYTDALSLGTGLTAIALIKLALVKSKFGLIIPASFIAVFGICIKITSAIPLIAAAVTIFAFGTIKINVSKKRLIVYLLNFLIIGSLLLTGINALCRSSQIYLDSKEKSNPLICWVALGLTGNGSYAENYKLSDYVNSLETSSERGEYSKAYIKEHLREAITLSHIRRKTQYNFASGLFSCYDYTTLDEHGSILYKIFDRGGAFFGRSAQISFLYVALIYVALTLGSIRALVLLVKNKKEKPSDILLFPKVLVDVSMFGIMLFLFIWESNNRQLYNQLPILILGLFSNAWNPNFKKYFTVS